MKKSTKDAIKIVKDNKLVISNVTFRFEYYKVKGAKCWYEVIYDKLKDYYSCNCPNVRQTYCKHIKSVLIFKGGEDTDQIDRLEFM